MAYENNGFFGLWPRESKKGTKYYAGKIPANVIAELADSGSDVSVMVFKVVSDNPKAPKMSVALRPKDDDGGSGSHYRKEPPPKRQPVTRRKVKQEDVDFEEDVHF